MTSDDLRNYNHRIVFLNGPPRCGKDTIGNIVQATWKGVRLYKMSQPLKDAFAAVYNIPWNLRREILEDKKDEIYEPAGMTPREWQIWFAEEVMKPKFGDKIFGYLAVEQLKSLSSFTTTVITDTGFQSECVPIIKHFRQGNCFLINVSRPGQSFAKDSRGFISGTTLNINYKPIHNEFDFLLLKEQVKRALTPFLGEPK